MTDEDAMRMALAQAHAAETAGEVPIGAVVLYDGRIVGVGENRVIRENDASAHAEIVALRAAGRALSNYRLSGCTVVATLEPCTMCAGALMHARIARLVYAAPDLKAGADGSVLQALNFPGSNHHVQVTRGVLHDEAAALLRAFFARRRASSQERP